MTMMPKLISNLKPRPNRRDLLVTESAQKNDISIPAAACKINPKKKSAIDMADFS